MNTMQSDDWPSITSFMDEVDAWTDIVSVRCGIDYVAALTSDGTVHMVGADHPVAEEVASWDSVVDIAASRLVLSGLTSDGSLLLTGLAPTQFQDPDLEKWSKVTDIEAGMTGFIAGIKPDHTVVVSSKFEQGAGSTATTQWADIIQISGGMGYLLGLQSDGTVVAAGWQSEEAWQNVSLWRDIMDIASGDKHSVGLTQDGMVLAEGNDKFGQCDVSIWNDEHS